MMCARIGMVTGRGLAGALRHKFDRRLVLIASLALLGANTVNIGADTLGKTIIFAKNHQHAHFIQERFDANYPHLKGSFTRVIDNQETYAQDLIDKFSDPKRRNDAPQIAISVDMLDTGIDVPDVLNLIFFKIVRSKTKFWQMIGRGTRLRPDIFGPGADKEFFYVFDYCGNFEFFNENAEGVEGNVQESIGTLLFRLRIDLLAQTATTRADGAASRSDLSRLRVSIIDLLHHHVAAMNPENFIVRLRRRAVEEYQKRERWDALTESDYGLIQSTLSGLPTQLQTEDPLAKSFDLLLLKIQLGTLQRDPGTAALILRVREIASQLEELERIPAVAEQMAFLHELQSDEFWSEITLPMLEEVRTRLRLLVTFLPRSAHKVIVTNFEDELSESVEISLPHLSGAIDRSEYKKKFRRILEAHQDDLALKKVRYNEPLTSQDLKELERMLFESGEMGTHDDFKRCYGDHEQLGVFVRKLVGLDREAAKRAFDQYLETTSFNSRQIEFINLIIDYLTQNGVMDPGLLFAHPFTNIHPEGPAGLFSDEDAEKIVSIVRTITLNAAAS